MELLPSESSIFYLIRTAWIYKNFNSGRMYNSVNFYDKERIENLGIQFRNAIEKAQINGERDEINYFRNFPRGCCGDTCDLLSHYLLESGISTRYVCGTFYGKTTDKFQSHAWLLYKDRVIIDITGDQFKYDADFLYYDKCVYVGKKMIFTSCLI